VETGRESCFRIKLAGPMTPGLTYDVTLRDESSAKNLIHRLGEHADISEVVLIASKNDVGY
jgi:hypothetical protein